LKYLKIRIYIYIYNIYNKIYNKVYIIKYTNIYMEKTILLRDLLLNTEDNFVKTLKIMNNAVKMLIF